LLFDIPSLQFLLQNNQNGFKKREKMSLVKH